MIDERSEQHPGLAVYAGRSTPTEKDTRRCPWDRAKVSHRQQFPPPPAVADDEAEGAHAEQKDAGATGCHEGAENGRSVDTGLGLGFRRLSRLNFLADGRRRGKSRLVGPKCGGGRLATRRN